MGFGNFGIGSYSFEVTAQVSAITVLNDDGGMMGLHNPNQADDVRMRLQILQNLKFLPKFGFLSQVDPFCRRYKNVKEILQELELLGPFWKNFELCAPLRVLTATMREVWDL